MFIVLPMWKLDNIKIIIMPVSLFLYGLQKSMDVISIDCYFHCTVYDLREMNNWSEINKDIVKWCTPCK